MTEEKESVKPREIEGEQDAVIRNLESIKNLTQSLKEELKPVISEVPTKEKDGKMNSPRNSPMGQWFQSLNGDLEKIIDTIRYMRDNVAL